MRTMRNFGVLRRAFASPSDATWPVPSKLDPRLKTLADIEPTPSRSAGRTATARVERTLGSMLGEGVALRVGALHGRAPRLHPKEETFVSGVHPKRAREFRFGRGLAHELLRELRQPHDPIEVGPHREPVWPTGIVGSISHAAGICGVAIAKAREVLGLGIDIERGGPLDEDLWDMVGTDRERSDMQTTLDRDEGDAAKLLFAAKEALYKAQFPLSQRFLEFRDVVLEPSSPTRSQVRILDPAAAAALGGVDFQLTMQSQDGIVLAACLAVPR